MVDRLLASPRYGERMAVRWLDAARYADTNGYQTDGERFMWRWRDWVIDAFNRNMPYDRFTVEQIAGDMLPHATPSQILATGFNRNHRGNGEGGIIPEEYAVEYVVDRVDTTSTVWLGLTLGCARCHDHKYDPFTQKEFYQVFAYFNNVPERGKAFKYGNSPPVMPAPTAEQQAVLAALDTRSGRRARAPRATGAGDRQSAARVGAASRRQAAARLGAVRETSPSICRSQAICTARFCTIRRARKNTRTMMENGPVVAQAPAAGEYRAGLERRRGGVCAGTSRAGGGVRRQAIRGSGQRRATSDSTIRSRCRPGSIPTAATGAIVTPREG